MTASRLRNVTRGCYSDAQMKLLAPVTNSFVMTAALLAVIIGSLCFSVGEGMRLTPFPVTALSQIEDASTAFSVKETNVSLSKYGPLDVPAQSQKRGKRNTVELASASTARRELVFTFVGDTFAYEADHLNLLPHLARLSGRGPPLNS
jgi:hypothetical protein